MRFFLQEEEATRKRDVWLLIDDTLNIKHVVFRPYLHIVARLDQTAQRRVYRCVRVRIRDSGFYFQSTVWICAVKGGRMCARITLEEKNSNSHTSPDTTGSERVRCRCIAGRYSPRCLMVTRYPSTGKIKTAAFRGATPNAALDDKRRQNSREMRSPLDIELHKSLNCLGRGQFYHLITIVLINSASEEKRNFFRQFAKLIGSFVCFQPRLANVRLAAKRRLSGNGFVQQGGWGRSPVGKVSNWLINKSILISIKHNKSALF